MGGGGGGDDGYAQKQQQTENKKAAARNALNAAFGIAPTVAPSSADFQVPNQRKSWNFNPLQGFVPDSLTKYNPAGEWTGGGTDPGMSTDPTSYGGAMGGYQRDLAEAAKNKTARDTLYSTVRDNAFTAGKRGFDERKTNAARDNKFALFAQGLQGGSVDVDQNALIDRTYKQGLLDLGGKADAARTDLRNSDEQSRLQLLQSIDAGMDQSSALSSALGQLQVNSEKAYSNAQGTNIGDLFGDAGLLYTKSQAARGRQSALDTDIYGLFSRNNKTKNPGASGFISNVGV